MPLAIISLGILLLFFLIIVFRLNAFIAFIVVSLSVGIAQGMELNSVVTSIEEGIGNTIGFLIIILALGQCWENKLLIVEQLKKLQRN